MAEKPLHMLVVVSAFLNVRYTHCAKPSLLAPFNRLLPYVQTFVYIWKIVLKILKHQTSNGYNACEVCDSMMIKSSTTHCFVHISTVTNHLKWASGNWLGSYYL
jgi:hypothetical protein